MEQEDTTWSIESPKALGAALRALREDAGLTQQDLADQLGTSRHRLSRIEDGQPSNQVRLLLQLLRRVGAEMRIVSGDA